MTKSLVEFKNHIRKSGLRMTRERKDLVELILALKGHFSADQVLEKMRKIRISGSRATLYRLLPVLVKAGLIEQILLSEGQTQFEVTWNRAHHDHLICSECDSMIEFQDNTIEILQREIANKYGFELKHHVMELVGRCSKCQKN